MNEIVKTKEEVVEFDYSLVDKEISEFLRSKEMNIGEILQNHYTKLGRELKEAQEKLAQHGYGCFEKWYSYLGFKTNTVYRLIDRYNLILSDGKNQKAIEEMPMTLVREITKKNVDPELKQQVLSGEIKTTKEYKQAIKEKEVEKVKERVLLMFDAGQWQDIATHELLSTRGMAIVDDSIMSVVKFRKKEQVSLFNDTKTYKAIPQIVEVEDNSSYPTL